MKKFFIVLICILAFLAILGAIGYNIAVDYIQGTLIKTTVNSMLDSGELTLEELEVLAEAEIDEDAAPPGVGEGADKGQGGGEEPSKKPQAKAQKPASKKTKAELVESFSDKLIASIPRDDQDAMMKLIASRLSSADIKYLAELLIGGLTSEEWTKAYTLAKSRFSGEELEMVSMYYHRYRSQVLAK